MIYSYRVIIVLLIIILIIYMSYKYKEQFVSLINKKPEYFIVIICRIKNEHFMMDSFIPYYLSQGIDKIYLIDDNSDKPYSDLVIKNPNVEFIEGHLARKTGNQMADVNALYQNLKSQTTWVMNIDADEFVYSKKHPTIKNALLTTFKNADCVFVPWVMFSFNNREKDGNHVINEYLNRWDHDKKHPHPNNDHKNRCRYDEIECKSIFKTKSFLSMNDCHKPTQPVNNSIDYRESVYNNKQRSVYYKNLREKDIKNAIMLCNHYRFSSLDKIKKKCNKSSLGNYKSSSCVDNCVLSDHPEVYDDYLKTKINIKFK
jgi:hypothetical protein